MRNIIVALLVIMASACVSETEENTQLANPASVFCDRQGYTLEIRDGEGGQSGFCVFDDGTECEEWAFFRGECGQDKVKVECAQDGECVPEQCCHPTSCTRAVAAPDCSETMCTMECAPGTMDCGQGECKCLDGMCEAVLQ